MALAMPGILGHSTINLVFVLVVLASVLVSERRRTIQRLVWQRRLR
jgi:hypothetical protein